MSGSHIERREFMQFSAAGVALAAMSNAALGVNSPPRFQLTGQIDDAVRTRADVLVVGGGTAGT
ncbi:MAG: twin-arginine translocation signal domain-containing protein, partial [Sedimentisphaerales bacterium]|nr:twin-arginine translocation signal domain-containing protein [Sedimentisphaerales bacterium]